MAIEFPCHYDVDTEWAVIEDVYFCDLTNSLNISNSNAVITSMKGTHFDNHSNADVVGFRAYEKTLHFLPKGLEKYFNVEKFEFLAFWTTGMKEIHQEDLALFTNIKYFSLYDNDVEVIESNLFKFNPNIKYIGLGQNKIKFIDENVFRSMQNLHTVYLDGNVCISKVIHVNNYKIRRDLPKELKEKCNKM